MWSSTQTTPHHSDPRSAEKKSQDLSQPELLLKHEDIYPTCVFLQITEEALSSTTPRRWKRRATCWTSWRSSVCLGPGGPGRGSTPPGPSPRCWTSQWTDMTQIPETSEAPPPVPCSPTGCSPTAMNPALLSARTSAPSAPSTLTKSLCTPLQREEEPSSDTPEARRREVKTRGKMACSRCRVLLAGVARCCPRCSVQTQTSEKGANR